MREPNARVRPPREKFELSLDGRQVASAVVAALVLVAVVFVLGLEVGKQIAARRAERAPAGDLEALDRAPPPAPVKDESLTFHDRLTKDAPARLPPMPAARPEPRPPPPAPAARPEPKAPPPLSSPKLAAAPVASPAEAVDGTAVRPEPVDRLGTGSAPSAEAEARGRRVAKPWTVQLAAAQERADAERIAGKFSGLNARVEEADVPGRGRYYRVRVGGFDSRDSAERYLRDVARETGAKGFVTATR